MADLRGEAARQMMSQDAAWIADSMLSFRSAGETAGWISSMLHGHAARIVYEGLLALETADPAVGRPELTRELTHHHGAAVARARHVGKMLDDTKRPFDDLSEEIAAFYAAHQTEFLGNSRWFARWLESDVGILVASDGCVLWNSISGHLRMGIPPEIRLDAAGPVMREIAIEMGSALAVVGRAAGRSIETVGRIDYASLEHAKSVDRRVIRYLRARFDSSMPITTKLLLLTVESELNVLRYLLPITSAEHREAVFRAVMVSLFHVLRAVDEVLVRFPAAQSGGTSHIRSYFQSEDVRALLDDRAMRALRNRCMHYEIRSSDIVLDQNLPLFGILEAVAPGRSLGGLEALTFRVIGQLSDAMRDWR